MRETTINPSYSDRASYSVRSAESADDRNAILRVCHLSSLNCTPEKYVWNYTRNPVGNVWCGVALHSATQQVIGTTALFPRVLLVNGIPLRAAIAGDFAVDPKHRTLYVAMSLQRSAVHACMDDQFDLLYAFPNNSSLPIQIRAGYTAIGSFVAGVRVLHSRKLLNREHHDDWLAPAADVLDWLVARTSRQSYIRKSEEYLFRRLPVFDERFDSLWTKVLKHYVAVVERNSEYANWRFVQCPTKKYEIFAAVHRRNEEVGGYVVSWTNSGKTRISDIMALEGVFDGLLAAFIDSERDRGTSCLTIAYFGGKRFVHCLRRFGFLFRRTPAQVLACVNPRMSVAQHLLSTPESWFLLDGDSDC